MFMDKANQDTPMSFPMVMGNKPAGEIVMTIKVIPDNVDSDAQAKREQVMLEQKEKLESFHGNSHENEFSVQNRREEIAENLKQQIATLKSQIAQDQ